MLLMIVLIVMIISSALMLALLSGFLPFVQNYGNMMQYTSAYYGALSAVERGLLAVRYAGPGFDGESGRTWSGGTSQIVNTGSAGDARFDHFYTYGNGQDSLYRSVKSSTNQVPVEGQGNVDPNFVDQNFQDSYNYNALTYGPTEIIPLGTIGEVSTDKYYTSLNQSFNYREGGDITVNFRFNPYLSGQFALKQSFNPLVSPKHLSGASLPFVNWTVRGQYNGNSFSLLPKRNENIHKSLNDLHRVGPFDTVIRGTQLNQNQSLIFGEFHDVFGKDKNTQNIISLDEQALKNFTYKGILTNRATSQANFTLSLLNILQTPVGVYPFLEYQVVSNSRKIADRFYTIQGEGKVNNYHIKMQVKKPTLPQPALGAFTIIF